MLNVAPIICRSLRIILIGSLLFFGVSPAGLVLCDNIGIQRSSYLQALERLAMAILLFVAWAWLGVDHHEICFVIMLDFERFACSIHNLNQPIDRDRLDLCGGLCE